MPSPTDSPAKTARADRPRRRSQAERSATTRRRLMKAAITCLHRYGYSATTTVLVCERAGVSRGAMLHQFPTKVDLVLAVVEYVFSLQKRYYVRKLARFPAGRERFMALTDVAWTGQAQTPGLAMIEILVAARSDEELARRLPPLAEAIDQDAYDSIWDLAQEAGIRDRGKIDTLVRLHQGAMRGLAIEMMYAKSPKAFDDAIELLKTYKRFLVDQLVADV